ncbi:hypothetical protein DH2020_028412 [Rehmannia glutinosa]|uniref:Uncharacterized protein n=1 Tax=Rehmannia glutinosa TaxID=99300 RepID=A0ABR0VRF9_REHGL
MSSPCILSVSFPNACHWMENNGIEESWEIVNYCDLLEDDEDKKTSKLGWILSAGLSLGKKIVITGFVISSAPIVFPPLVVISALGCALSLPFGVLFASYAFTDKLMTKLMPPSPRPLMLEYHDQTTLLPDDVDEFERIDFEQEDEKEQSEAVKDAVEMRIELVDDETEQKSNLGGRDDEVIEVGYSKENDDDEMLLRNREDNVDVITSQVQTKEGDSPLLLEDNNKNEKMEKTVTVVKETENGSGKNVADKKEDKTEKVEKTVVTVKGTPKKDAKGKSSSSKEIERRGKRKNLSALKFPRKKKEEEKGLVMKETENKLSTDELDSVSSDKVQAGDQVKKNIVLGNENKDDKQVSVNDDVKKVESLLEKEHKKPVAVKDSAMNGVSREMTDESDTSTTTSVVASEIANVDGGIDKKVEVSTTTIYNDPAGGNYNQSETIADGVGEGSLEKASITSMPAVSKHDEETPEVRGETKGSSLYSGEVTFGDDEKIWKKIDAIRVIVGYKAPRSP